jgi:aminoglycoside phosphotransferase
MGKVGINMARDKKELFLLLDKLPSTEISAVKRYLQYIIDKVQEERMLKILEEAPIDDEPLTDKEIKAIEEAREDIKAGRVKPFSKVIKELKL